MVPVPAFLETLRACDRAPDWRRDDVALEPAGIVIPADAVLAHRLEADALRAKARLDAAAALEAFALLAIASEERRDWALQEIWQISQHWNRIEVRAGDAGLDALRARAIAALRPVCACLPKGRVAYVSLAPILQAAQGVDAALDLLEAGIAAEAPVADACLRLLADTLAKAPTARRIQRALGFPEAARRRAGFHWFAFEVHRAVAFASILTYRRDLLPRLGPDPVPAAAADIEAAMARALAAAATLPPAAVAGLFAALASNQCFFHSPLPQAEAARLALIEATIAAADKATGTIIPPLLGTLNRLLHCTIRFWEDSVWRRACCRRIVELAEHLREPSRSWFRGRFGFAAEDYALAAEAFADCAALAPDGIGPGTYVDHRSVPARLVARGDVPLLGAEGARFEVLADRPAGGLPTIIVAANDIYLHRYLTHYALQLGKLSPAGHFHVHCIGETGDAAAEIASLAGALPGHRVTLSHEVPPLRAPYYFATARFVRLTEWRERFAGTIAVTDIDSPWSAAPAPFLAERMGNADVGLALNARVRVAPVGRFAFPHNLYPLSPPWVAVPAWIVALAPTPGAQRFAELLSKLADAELRAAMRKPVSANWTIDQNILCAAYAHAVRCMPGITFADLGSPFEVRQRDAAAQADPPRGHHWLGRPSDLGSAA